MEDEKTVRFTACGGMFHDICVVPLEPPSKSIPNLQVDWSNRHDGAHSKSL
jgi:hypothetical protein